MPECFQKIIIIIGLGQDHYGQLLGLFGFRISWGCHGFQVKVVVLMLRIKYRSWNVFSQLKLHVLSSHSGWRPCQASDDYFPSEYQSLLPHQLEHFSLGTKLELKFLDKSIKTVTVTGSVTPVTQSLCTYVVKVPINCKFFILLLVFIISFQLGIS